jgi:hypothetical protein
MKTARCDLPATASRFLRPTRLPYAVLRKQPLDRTRSIEGSFDNDEPTRSTVVRCVLVLDEVVVDGRSQQRDRAESERERRNEQEWGVEDEQSGKREQSGKDEQSAPRSDGGQAFLPSGPRVRALSRPGARGSRSLRASAAHHVVDHDLGLVVRKVVGLDAHADRHAALPLGGEWQREGDVHEVRCAARYAA